MAGTQPILMLPVAVDANNSLMVNAEASAAVPVVSATSAKAPLAMLQVVTDSSNRLLVRVV